MATLIQSANFMFVDDQSPVRYAFAAAIVRVALEVLAEDAATPNHAARVELAHKIVANPLAVRDGLEPWRAAISNDDTIVGVATPSQDAALAAIRRAFALLAA